MFKKLNRTKRQKWEAGLAWFRLRYLEPPTRCLNLLSRSLACGRVALYYRPGEAVSQLYLGVPGAYIRLVGRMAADFGFSLKPKPPEVEIPPAQRMTAVPDLPWDSPFMAHIANEFAFVSLLGGDQSYDPGQYLPQPPSTGPGHGPATWKMPDNPPPGLSLKPSWDGQPPSAYLVAMEPDPRRWPLGRSLTGVPLHVAGRVNIYGRGEAVADWLVQQVTQMVSDNPANLVVIDGAGDLVPMLKRKAAVTRLLGKQLVYVDTDGDLLTGGFNPLAAVPGETEAETVERWQYWFLDMGTHPQALHLLAQAWQDGVRDIPTLQKWLKQPRQQMAASTGSPSIGSTSARTPSASSITLSRSMTLSRSGELNRPILAASSLTLALNRLAADSALRDWLEWPANRFDILPDGALFFACQGAGWDRQQLLRAVLLGVIGIPDVRLVVHGFRWKAADTAGYGPILISNGPPLPESTIILTASRAEVQASLAARFLGEDERLAENLALLEYGQGIIITGGEILPAAWTGTQS